MVETLREAEVADEIKRMKTSTVKLLALKTLTSIIHVVSPPFGAFPLISEEQVLKDGSVLSVHNAA